MKKSFAWLLAIAVCCGLAFGQVVQIKDQKAFFYADLECTGPYAQMQVKIGETYAKISAFIDQNGWRMSGPSLEMYLDNPEETPVDKLRTEISIPVVKK